MTDEKLLSYVDHTLLKPEATWADVQKICDEAVKHNTASVCINPCFVKRVADYLRAKTPKIAVCTVIGFPLGANTTEVKAFEAQKAIEDGADELDMVINIGKLKEKDYDYIEREIRALKKAAGGKILKVIIETCLLTDDEKAKMCEIVCKAGADYIKTSTGFSSSGATFDDIALFADCIKNQDNKCRIKAAGGISTREDMEKFIALGADRLGTSRAVKILKGV